MGAGGICCGFTHGAVCPVDVVKTRIQLEPTKYNKGLIGGFRQVIADEGVMALSTGLAATGVGYFIQGWFKFGGAEFIADIFLCPLEACRIRSVSDPGYASSLPGVAARLIKEEGVL